MHRKYLANSNHHKHNLPIGCASSFMPLHSILAAQDTSVELLTSGISLGVLSLPYLMIPPHCNTDLAHFGWKPLAITFQWVLPIWASLTRLRRY